MTVPDTIPGYTDLVRIGSGGFSVVYRAYEKSRHRFLREVRLTGRLSDHPNVVTILDAGTTDGGRPYLVTELYERGSLRDQLAAGGPLPPAEVARIGSKIADALAAAHQLGMLHRDVKPSNILLSRYDEPAL